MLCIFTPWKWAKAMNLVIVDFREPAVIKHLPAYQYIYKKRDKFPVLLESLKT
jgi:hypothetical protein